MSLPAQLHQDLVKIQAAGGIPCYTDTDSIFFAIEPEKLEALKEKLVCHNAIYGTRFWRFFFVGENASFRSFSPPGAYKEETKTPIHTWDSLGSKNYGFKCEGGDTVMK